MKQVVAALLAAILLAELSPPAACAPAQAAGPFEIVPAEPPARRSHFWAYASFLTGAGLIGASFAVTHHANLTYERYLAATDPAEVERLYDQTVREDRLSTASLLAGEALIATGAWLRFLRRPPRQRVSLDVDAGRCAVSLHF